MSAEESHIILSIPSLTDQRPIFGLQLSEGQGKASVGKVNPLRRFVDLDLSTPPGLHAIRSVSWCPFNKQVFASGW